MLSFFAENLGTIAVGLIVAGIVALSAAKLVRDRRKGNGCAGCACEGCPNRSNCGAE